MTYYIFTLGCQMNRSDSERLATVLESCGFKSAPEKEADLIIVNACSVRQSAVDRIYGKLKVWKKIPNQSINKLTNKLIFITGCLLEEDKKKLKKKVDLIFNIKDLPKLPKWLNTQKVLQKNSAMKIKDYFQIPPLLPITHYPLPRNKSSAFVPIMTGCDNFCTYCAVPYTRGREFSRKMEDILSDVKNLIKKGYKEIILLGQNVNSYKLKVQNSNVKTKTKNLKPLFVKLLQKLIKIPGDFKMKFLTSNPWDFSDDLIKLVAKEPKLSKEIHLPLQSGDDKILRKMNRKYTVKKYLELVNNLRSAISDLRLSTDIIVGFPSETKKQFENTVSVCKSICFEKAYIACYSPRPSTAAFKLKDNVSCEEKKRRWKILDRLINK